MSVDVYNCTLYVYVYMAYPCISIQINMQHTKIIKNKYKSQTVYNVCFSLSKYLIYSESAYTIFMYHCWWLYVEGGLK